MESKRKGGAMWRAQAVQSGGSCSVGTGETGFHQVRRRCAKLGRRPAHVPCSRRAGLHGKPSQGRPGRRAQGRAVLANGRAQRCAVGRRCSDTSDRPQWAACQRQGATAANTIASSLKVGGRACVCGPWPASARNSEKRQGGTLAAGLPRRPLPNDRFLRAGPSLSLSSRPGTHARCPVAESAIIEEIKMIRG